MLMIFFLEADSEFGGSRPPTVQGQIKSGLCIILIRWKERGVVIRRSLEIDTMQLVNGRVHKGKDWPGVTFLAANHLIKACPTWHVVYGFPCMC